MAEREAAIERQKRETAEKHLEDERRRKADALAKQKKETAEHSSNEASIAIAMQKAETAHEGTQRGQLGTKEGDDGRGKVQLWEGGPYWAEMNIGAEKPEDYGYYFWWGDTKGYKRVSGDWVANDGSSSNFWFGAANTPTYGEDSSQLRAEEWITSYDVIVPEHDAAHIHWGGDWRMPTVQELSGLSSKCDWTWTTMNGVQGYLVKGKGTYASASIFLPCAGLVDGTSLELVGSDGYYWSSVPHSDDYDDAWYLYFYSRRHTTYYIYYRLRGRSVRPVQGFTN